MVWLGYHITLQGGKNIMGCPCHILKQLLWYPPSAKIASADTNQVFCKIFLQRLCSIVSRIRTYQPTTKQKKEEAFFINHDFWYHLQFILSLALRSLILSLYFHFTLFSFSTLMSLSVGANWINGNEFPIIIWWTWDWKSLLVGFNQIPDGSLF